MVTLEKVDVYKRQGEFSVTITCTHDKTHIEGKTLSDCTVGGYTGDTVCDTCGKVVEQGQTLEPGEHQEAVLDVKDATCYVTGYTGDTYCSCLLYTSNYSANSHRRNNYC